MSELIDKLQDNSNQCINDNQLMKIDIEGLKEFEVLARSKFPLKSPITTPRNDDFIDLDDNVDDIELTKSTSTNNTTEIDNLKIEINLQKSEIINFKDEIKHLNETVSNLVIFMSNPNPSLPVTKETIIKKDTIDMVKEEKNEEYNKEYLLSMIESETNKILNQVNNLHMIPLNTKIDKLDQRIQNVYNENETSLMAIIEREAKNKKDFEDSMKLQNDDESSKGIDTYIHYYYKCQIIVLD